MIQIREKITLAEFEFRMEEIENLQLEFERIFLNRNGLVKLLNFRKAKKLHEVANKKFNDLINCEIIYLDSGEVL
jgi:hypothetical protein